MQQIYLSPSSITKLCLWMLQLLQDEEGLAVQKCEGRVGPLPPYTWALWFRYSFKLSQPCTLELDLQMPGEALLKAASLVLLDLDTSQVLPSSIRHPSCQRQETFFNYKQKHVHGAKNCTVFS